MYIFYVSVSNLGSKPSKATIMSIFPLSISRKNIGMGLYVS